MKKKMNSDGAVLAKVGCVCIWSSCFSGPIKVKFLGLTKTKKAKIKFFKKSGPYHKDEEIEVSTTWLTPLSCYKQTGVFTYISLPHKYVQYL